MKRRCLYFFALSIVLFSILSGAVASDYDLDSITWGESTETLIEMKGEPSATAETEKIGGILKCYRYETEIAEIPAYIDYGFEDNHLVMITIMLDAVYADSNMYFADYDILKGLLVKKYGAPDNDLEIWNNGLLGRMYKNDRGKALLNDAVARKTIWKDSKALITLEMHKDNTDSGVGTFISFNDWKFFEPDTSLNVTPTPKPQNLFTDSSEVLTPAVGEWVNCGDEFKFMFYYQPMMTKSQSYIIADGMFILFRVHIKNLTAKEYHGISGFELSKTEGGKTIRYPVSNWASLRTSNAWEIDTLNNRLYPYRTMDTYLVFDVSGSVDDDWVLTFSPRNLIFGEGAVCSVKMKLPKISYES